MKREKSILFLGSTPNFYIALPAASHYRRLLELQRAYRIVMDYFVLDRSINR